jgi:hypothetical protein
MSSPNQQLIRTCLPHFERRAHDPRIWVKMTALAQHAQARIAGGAPIGAVLAELDAQLAAVC